MPITDWDGTTSHEIGKVYDYDGTTSRQTKTVNDWDGTTSHLIYQSSVEVIDSPVSVTIPEGAGGTWHVDIPYTLDGSYDQMKIVASGSTVPQSESPNYWVTSSFSISGAYNTSSSVNIYEDNQEFTYDISDLEGDGVIRVTASHANFVGTGSHTTTVNSILLE